MDLDNANNLITILGKVFTRVFLYPFMMFFAIGSRVGYDYFINKKMPNGGEIFAITLTSSFVATMVYLICDAFNVDHQYRLILVGLFGFIGHTALTYVLEHQEELIAKLLSRFGLKKK
jgi:uncharacterized membrane protein